MTNAITSIMASVFHLQHFLEDRRREIHAIRLQTAHHLRAMTRCLERAARRATFAWPPALAEEDRIDGDLIVLDSANLNDTSDLPRTVMQARHMHDDVNRGSEHLPDHPVRHAARAHHHHGLEP